MQRNAKDLILEARLLNSDPDTVSAWLEKTNSSAYEKSSIISEYDQEIEMALLKRGSPLIALSLAQFGTNVDMLKLIWAKSEQSSEKHTGNIRALRLAVLSNQNVGRNLIGRPALISVIGQNEFTVFLNQASEEELEALGQNPRTAFLEALYKKAGVFEALTDDRWREVIAATIGNPRLSEKYDNSDDTDGYREFQHNSVFSAIYALPTKVTVTQEWAATLAWLLGKTLPYLPHNTTLNDIETTMARWRLPLFEKPADATFHIDPSEYLRTYYGRLYFEYGIKKPVEEIMASDDRATRCAAYAWGQLTPEQVKVGAAKDKDEFLTWACSNKNLCRTQAQRDAVSEAAREFGDEDGNEGSRFYFLCTEQLKENPNWFNDDPNKEDMEAEMRQDSDQTIAAPSPELLTLIGKFEKVSSKIDIIYGIAIVAGIAILFQLFF